MISIPRYNKIQKPEGYEFGYYTFDTLPAVKVSNVETTQDMSENNKSDSDEKLIELPLDNDILFELQQRDAFCVKIFAQIEKGNIIEGQVYKAQSKLLKRYVIDGDKTYETIVLPIALTAQLQKMAHDDLGHKWDPQNLYVTQEIILLERIKTKCYKIHTEMLSMPEKK